MRDSAVSNPALLQVVKKLNAEIDANEHRLTNGRLTYWDGRYAGLVFAIRTITDELNKDDAALD